MSELVNEITGDTAADAAAAARAITEATKGLDPERADLLAILARSRNFMRYATRDLTDDQARQRTTASELCLGGLVKHVTMAESNWADFIVHGAGSAQKSFEDMTPEDFDLYKQGFTLGPDETLQGVLDDYAKAAERTDDLLRTLPDLNLDHALPEAPWFPPGQRWTARRVLLHVITETTQHSGHADIIRESLDGAKTMG
jgi:uncharacterized damage-inducible protein DinB